MTLHLIKLSVGPDTLSELAQWQSRRVRDLKRQGQTPELVHVTRNMPRRAGELLEGGSIYWVIKGWVCARQRLLELRPMVKGGVPYCGLVYDSEMVRVRLQPRRAFQGWRYLEGKDAPPDVALGSGEDGLPDELRRELSELGLL